MRCQINQKPAQSISHWRQLTCFHFSLVLFLSKRHKILIVVLWLIVYLRIWFLHNVLLVLNVMVLHFVVFYALYALGLWTVEKYVVWTLFLVNYQWFHGLSVHKTLRTFGFERLVAFVADVVFVAFGYDIVFCFVRQVVVGSDLFWRSVKLFLFVELHFIDVLHVVFNILCVFSVVGHVFDREFRMFILIFVLDHHKVLIFCIWFSVFQLQIFNEFTETLQCSWKLINESFYKWPECGVEWFR